MVLAPEAESAYPARQGLACTAQLDELGASLRSVGPQRSRFLFLALSLRVEDRRQGKVQCRRDSK